MSVLVFVFNFDLFKFSAAILEKVSDIIMISDETLIAVLMIKEAVKPVPIK